MNCDKDAIAARPIQVWAKAALPSRTYLDRYVGDSTPAGDKGPDGVGVMRFIGHAHGANLKGLRQPSRLASIGHIASCKQDGDRPTLPTR